MTDPARHTGMPLWVKVAVVVAVVAVLLLIALQVFGGGGHGPGRHTGAEGYAPAALRS